jgi:cellulose synthase/poly-beta-1,6-N-acetylglucosamine synthase-like glycosyltransferase
VNARSDSATLASPTAGEQDTAPLLLLGLDSAVVTDVISPLVAAGYPVRIGTVADLARGPWRLVVSGPALPGLGAMELVTSLRPNDDSAAPGLLVVGSAAQQPVAANAVPGVQRLVWPFEPEALVACVQGMLGATEVVSPSSDAWPARSTALGSAPAPASAPQVTIAQPRHLILDESRFLAATTQEQVDKRAGRMPGDGFVVSLQLDELQTYRSKLPPASVKDIWKQVAVLVELEPLPDEQMAYGRKGDLLLLLPCASEARATHIVNNLSRRIVEHSFAVQGQSTQFSPVIGYASLRKTRDAAQAVRHARRAAAHAQLHLDLQPALYKPGQGADSATSAKAAAPKAKDAQPSWIAAWFKRHTLIMQYLITTLGGLIIPFCVYWGFGAIGLDISGAVYVFVVFMLILTAASIWLEGFLALKRMDPPDRPATPYPAASAIIAAYLPNEAPIIEDTVLAFLKVQYPGQLQVILAYNTPRDMPDIEARLQQIARENPRFSAMRVLSSTSKAQNVNAALAHATGEFTAVFDADHQPDPESFRRAWRWISHGVDVVQGHCFIRNGDASWVAKMVAVEFEQIYTVSHPGRARLHGFGIFGGSNGYWRTDLLRELRMHGFMLTEDIDSSMRAVVRGRKIISDPYLVSRELAPETMSALAKQRLRWAQGWFQISLKWVMPSLRSPFLSVRQKIGMMQLLLWRELYPWVSIQVVPLIAYWAVQAGSLWAIDWWIPLFIGTTLFTLSTPPGQIYFTYKLADPQIKKNGSWFWFFVWTSTLFYSGMKNAWTRISHLKEALGEKTWVVTARKKT